MDIFIATSWLVIGDKFDIMMEPSQWRADEPGQDRKVAALSLSFMCGGTF